MHGTMDPIPATRGHGLLGMIGWPRLLAWACLSLAAASVLYALPVLGTYLPYEPFLAVVPWLVVLFTALVAWPLWFAAIVGFAESDEVMPRARRAAAIAATVLGVLGVAVGITALPPLFPTPVDSFFCAYEWQCFLFEGWFPYVPTVFASVVVSHAVIAALAAAQSRDRTAGRLLTGAAGILLIVALVSLIVQLAGAFHDGWWGIASLTAPGYLAAALGAGRESRARATAVPWRGPAGPSRGPSP